MKPHFSPGKRNPDMSFENNWQLFSTPEMTETFSLSRQLRGMMRFEWALTCALEKAGIAEAGAGAVLEALLDAKFVDIESLQNQALDSGNIAIPFVQQLTSRVQAGKEAASRTIHLGATSQDVLDTALVLQIRDGLRQIVESIERLDRALTIQVRAHAKTVLSGRTWLQPGPPTTLGLKLAGTLAALRRHRNRVDKVAADTLRLQFGGAVGTLAALGATGTQVSAELARTLDLKEPELPWHAQRDCLVEVAQVLALLVGSLGKFAKDISLLMQAEVAEVSEPTKGGRGGSSTMPQKKNPVACATVLASAARVPGLAATMLVAMPQEHERGLGLWQAEWDTLPEIFRLTASALARSIEIAEGLEVHPARMASNLDGLHGLPQSEAVSAVLAQKIGRSAAHEILRKATQQAADTKQHLANVLKANPEVTEHLTSAEIDQLLQPREYLGSAQRFIHRVLGESDA
jgi:3-carboxy-cis,cis-muconate cycloisomerase